MKINILTIPHDEQRYPTVGDYWFDNDGMLQLRVSKMSDERYEWLVILHEFIELTTCKLMGVDFKSIDKFDSEYENARECPEHPEYDLRCGCPMRDEPGDDPHAPYHRQHQVATICERAIAFLLGVNWSDYDNEVECL